MCLPSFAALMMDLVCTLETNGYVKRPINDFDSSFEQFVTNFRLNRKLAVNSKMKFIFTFCLLLLCFGFFFQFEWQFKRFSMGKLVLSLFGLIYNFDEFKWPRDGLGRFHSWLIALYASSLHCELILPLQDKENKSVLQNVSPQSKIVHFFKKKKQ